MIKAAHRSFQRNSNQTKLFTPQRTEATEAEYSCLQTFQNGSFGCIEQANDIRHSSVLPNQSIASLTCPEINNEDIHQLLREIQILQFLSAEAKQNTRIIQQKQALIKELTTQRQECQQKIQTSNQRYYRQRKTVSATKQKISQSKQKTFHSIDKKINRLKEKICKINSVCSEHSYCLEKQLSNFSLSNSAARISPLRNKGYSHRRFYTQGQPSSYKTGAKEHRRKHKIYIPIYVPIVAPQPLSSWQQTHPYPYHYYYPQPQALRMQPNLAQSSKANKDSPKQYLDQSFTQKLKVFTSRLEGGLSKNSKRNSQLQYSQSRRSKRSSIKDKGSYIFSEIRGSDKSNSKGKNQPQFVSEEDNEFIDALGYSKMGFKVTTSNTQDLDSIQYPPLRKKPTSERKGNSIPIIEEINNSTVYVDVLSEKREQSSSDKDTIEKKYSTGRSNSKKQNTEQSAVDIDTNILDMLQHSPIKQQTELSSSPQSFRIRDKEELLGQSQQGQPLIKLQPLSQQKNNWRIQLNYLKQPSITSKYESTPRRLKETKQYEPNSKFYKIEDNLNFIDIVQLNPVSKVTREAKSSDQRASAFEDEDEDDLLKSIKLSTESIFSRGKKYNKSAIHESRRSSLLGERQISQSDIKGSKKVRQTVAAAQQRSEELDLAQQIRTTTPSRIVKGAVVKKKFKRGVQVMKQSIEEADEDEQDPVSGKIKAKRSKVSTQHPK